MPDNFLDADFIVIGAGSAGCAIAARLSEDPATRVLLLEAGGEDKNRWIHIPLGFGKTFADPSVNWCYETEPDPGAADRRVFWPRGKVLGGSCSINGMVYIRGQAEDFDHWRQLGNTGWAFDDVLPYFKRSEDQMRGARRISRHRRAALRLRRPGQAPDLRGLHRSAMSLGFPRNDDFNGAGQDGVGYHQTTTRNGKRCSTAVGYLRPAMSRANLRVVTNALTEKIVFDGQARRPASPSARTGRSAPRGRRAKSSCAAARINSPQLLMLSGIGRAEHLVATGIPVRAPSAGVGQSLQDHYSAPLKFKCAIADHGQRRDAEQPAQAQGRAAILRVQNRPAGDGDLARGAVRAHPAGAGLARHQVLMLAVQRRPAAGRAASVLGFHDDRLSVAAGEPRPHRAQKPQPGRCRRRSIRTTSRPRPTSKPSSTGSNCCAGSWHSRRCSVLSPSEFQPGPAIETDDQLLDYARQRGGTVFHPTSTCKMGVDAMAVVDPTCGCTASPDCASPTPRSCRPSYPATPTRRRS